MTLLPCAHCGSAAEKAKESDWNDGLNNLITAYSVTCTNSECSANVFGFRDESEAIAAWNRRADTSALEQLKARLIEGGARLPVDNLKMNAVECGMSIALALVEEQLRSKP